MFSAAIKSGAVPAVAPADPYFYDVSLLLSGDGTNGAQNNTFLDSSTNNFTITRNGNTTQGSFSPYTSAGSSWSVYFNGAVYMQASITSAAVLNGNSTIELWVYPSSLSAQQTFIKGGNFNFGTDSSNPAKLRIDDGANVGSIYTSTGTLVANTWNYIALVRSGNNLSFYINGALDSTNSSVYTFYTTNTTYIAAGAFNSSGTNVYTGYQSNLRVSTVARTISSIPTSPLTSDANTVLLTFQSNRFVDNSSNNYTFNSISGTPSVQRFNPFNPTAAYSTSTVGGSGYFDGSGDYLNAASNAAFGFGTGDFTMECWVYPVSWVGSYDGFISTLNSGTAIGVHISRDGVEVNGVSTTWGSALSLNTWTHLAVTRSGTSLKLFVNGAVSNTATNSANTGSASALAIGRRLEDYNGYYCNAYISNARVVKGTAVYTSTFTPPTTPLTAVSGTSLLANMTNAGIYDSAMINDLETVGNAQISTSVKKYGTGSMAFDGSGDYLLSSYGASTSPLEVFGAGDFTVEGWFYFNSSPSSQNVLLSNYQNSSSGWTLSVESNVIKFRALGDPVVVSGSTSISATTWYHIAIARSGTSIKVFLNGTQDGSATNSDNITVNSTQLNIGRLPNNSGYLNGYIDDLRITKGYARYTSSFTPPTAALPLY